MSRTFYITTAIPYANGAPHIGHAYERIATDAIQRFMRLDGRDTLFVTGMDEYGLKVQQTAAKEGVTPQAFVDAIAAQFEAMGEALNARADDIVRTTQERAQPLRAGDLGADGGQRRHLSVEIRRLVFGARRSLLRRERAERRPEGGKLAPSGAPAQWVEEESYFFRLSAYADRLIARYEAHPDFVTPRAVPHLGIELGHYLLNAYEAGFHTTPFHFKTERDGFLCPLYELVHGLGLGVASLQL